MANRKNVIKKKGISSNPNLENNPKREIPIVESRMYATPFIKSWSKAFAVDICEGLEEMCLNLISIQD